jgi:HEAT repeat protein
MFNAEGKFEALAEECRNAADAAQFHAACSKMFDLLVEAYKWHDDLLGHKVGSFLKELAQRVVPLLRELAATGKTVDHCWHAVQLLPAVKADDRDTFNLLAELLRNAPESVRAVAVLALEHYPRFRYEALSLLLEATSDPAVFVRWSAVGALMRFTELKERIKPLLPDLLADEDDSVRRQAQELEALLG